MFHLGAFYQSVDSAGATAQIDAVADQAISTNSKDMTVPSALPNLLAEAALSSQATPNYGQVQSPSLRGIANQDIHPIIAAAVFGGNPAVQSHFNSPRKLAAGEDVNFAINAAGGAAADNYGLVWLGDGAPKPVDGDIVSMRATATIQQAVGVWTNGALTFESSLPSGSYQVVGMRAQSADLVAARLVFIGGQFRPGVPAVNAVGDREWLYGRHGALGVFGQFDQNEQPTVDVIGGVAAAQNFILDLIKVK